jgi:hypothetical protein
MKYRNILGDVSGWLMAPQDGSVHTYPRSLPPLRPLPTEGRYAIDHDVPAVVILGGLNGLGVSRSLGRGHVSTYTLDTRRLSPGMWSRYTHAVLSRSLQGEALVETLAQLQSRLGNRPVLFNTHELAVLALSQQWDRVAAGFRHEPWSRSRTRLDSTSSRPLLDSRSRAEPCFALIRISDRYCLGSGFPWSSSRLTRRLFAKVGSPAFRSAVTAMRR